MRDEELEATVRRAREGDREAAGELFRRYEGRIRAAIRQRLAPRFRRRFDTEDVFQSAVAVTLEDLKHVDFRGEQALVAWLTTVAERRLLMTVRRHRAERRDVGRELTHGGAGDAAGGHTTPPRGAERAEVKAKLERAIARLPAAERRVIELRSYEGLSFDDIARLLGLGGKDAARNLFQSALKRMGQLVEHGPSPPET